MKLAIALLTLVLMLAPAAFADTITMTDGKSLQGTFKSGTATSIVFDVNGQSQTIPLASILTMTFSPRQAAPASQPAAAPATAPTAAPGPVTLNAGTRMMVKTSSDLVTGQVRSGDKFTAALQIDLVVGNTIIAPAGATMYGRVVEAEKARRLTGRAKLVIEITDIQINNQLQPIVTDQFAITGDRQGTLKKVAAGAAVGGIADGSDGAETGAAVGLGAAVLTPGKQIRIPRGSVLEFRLMQPITVGQ